MNELITYLEDKDDDQIVENIKIFLSKKRRDKEKHKVFQKLSAAASDKIMGPPSNKCMSKEEKFQYDSIITEIMEDGVWDKKTNLNKKLKKHGLKI